VRVLVNKAHTFGKRRAVFNNGWHFPCRWGAGTWQGNGHLENLKMACFVNITHLVNTIAPRTMRASRVFGGYWAKYGKGKGHAGRIDKCGTCCQSTGDDMGALRRPLTRT